jgi:REP element-mobilizing transposase RayT
LTPTLHLLINVFPHVAVPPSIVEIERYPQIKIGNDITLTCRADGNPVPSLRWRKEVWKENKFIDFVDGVQPDGKHIGGLGSPWPL